jgi:hypothetical protein
MLCLFILQWWLTVFNIFGIKICYDFPFKGISSSAQLVTLKIYLWHPSFGCLQNFPKIPIKLTLKNGLKGTNSDPPGPIQLSSQSIANQQQVCALYQPQQNVQKCWVKTILLHRTGMF